MKQYIDKSTIKAEVERRRKDWKYGSSIEAKFKREECDDILSFLDTIEVKDVDEEYNGKAMLHVLEKGVKQGKKELIEKACEYIRKHQCEYIDLDELRKAMKEE